MKEHLNDEDTAYGGTLYMFVTNIDLLTKLKTTNENTLNNCNSKINRSKSTSVIIIKSYDGVVKRQDRSMPLLTIIMKYSLGLPHTSELSNLDTN